MKKTLMIAAAMTLGTAAFAQSSMNTTVETSGYPPCSATVTDRCIQLYERGVRASANLTMIRNPASEAAVGGPYEPVATHSGMTHSGVGGPVDERTGYPPCDPGPGDDRCIQLYERGVTGAGN